MPRLISPYANPIGAGISAFRGISDVFMDRERMKMQKERFGLEKEREARIGEQERQEMELRKQTMEHNKWLWGIQKETKLKADHLEKFNAAVAKADAGGELNDEEWGYVGGAVMASPIFKDVPLDQIDDVGKNIGKLTKGIDQFWPKINEQLQQGKGVYVTEEQAPEWFNALNKVYDKQINRGKSRFSGYAEKRITQIYFDPRNGTMTPMLRVSDPNGEVYYAPMTMDRGTDENAPVLQLPYQLFAKNLQANEKMSKLIDAYRIKYGDKDAQKRLTTEREKLRENDVYFAGHQAVEDLLTANPKATSTEQYNTFMRVARQTSKDMGVVVSEKELVADATNFYKGKGTLTAYEAAKLPLEERKVVVQEKKATTEEEAKKETEQRKRDEDTAKRIREIGEGVRKREEAEEKRKLEEKKLEETKRHHKGLESTAERRVTIEAGRVKEGQVQLLTDAEGNVLRVPKRGGPAEPVVDKSGKPIKGKADLGLIDRKSKEVGKLIEDDDDIPDDDKEKLSDHASTLITQDPKLTPIQAKTQAKKELGVPNLSAFPDPKANKGRTGTDTETGKRFKSDGKRWVEVK